MNNLPLSENRTMNLIETIKLSNLIVNEPNNQSYLFVDQPFNKSIIEDKELYHFYKKEQIIFLIVLLILIIVGNSLVLLTLAYNKKRNKPHMTNYNYFIKHLAYTDLLVGLVSVSVDISWKITLSFNAGNLLCKLVKYSQQLVIYSSTYVLVALSLDRYDAVINPLNFNSRINRAKHMVSVAWLISALLSLPAIFLNKIQIKNNLSQCWIELSPYQWKLYFTLVTLSLFFIPTIIIFYCYICIIRTIWFQHHNDEKQASNIDRCIKEIEQQFTSKDPFLNQPQQHSTDLNNEHQEQNFLNKDQFIINGKYNTIDTSTKEQDQFNKNKEQSNIMKSEISQLHDHLSLKLNPITQSSIWSPIDNSSSCGDKLNNSNNSSQKFIDNLNDKNIDKFNDTFNTTSIDRTRLPNKSLFNSKLQKHHSFDQAFNHSSFNRISLNPKLNSIKEQNRLESSLKLDLLHQQKNNCMRVNSQGILPKARIKTLQMTFVIITVFICCWSPYIIWDLLQVYGYIKRSAETNPISTFIQSLAPLNSAANPLIFCFFSSKEVFQTIKLIWKRLCFNKQKKDNKLEQMQNRSLTNTTIRKNNSSPTTTSVCTTKSTSISKSLSRSKSTEN